MYLPEDRLQRHVTGQQALLQRHVTGQQALLQRYVPPVGRATATCDGPAGPAPATCRRAAAERRPVLPVGASDRHRGRRPRHSGPVAETRNKDDEATYARSCRRAIPPGEGAMRRKEALEFRPLRGRCRSETGAPLPCALRADCISRQLARRAGRSLTRRNGYKHRIGSSDMYLPRDRLLRHVPGRRAPGALIPPFPGRPEPPTPEPASASTPSGRPGRASPGPLLPEDGLQRHVTGPPTPLQRHVPAGGPATATCDGPAGPAPATCRRAAAERRSPTGIAAAGRDTPAPSRKPETKTTKRRTRAVVAAPFPLARAPCGGRKPWSFARCAGDAGRRPALHCRARFGRIAFSRQLARRAGRSLTRRNGYKHRTGSCDMLLVSVRRLP